MPILTHFEPDSERFSVLQVCTEDYDIGEDSNAEWPNNMLSRQTVVYSNGMIARADDSLTFAVDSDELDKCIVLASQATTMMQGVEVGMGSESSDEFSAFWICANTGDATSKIDEELVRARFGGTLFPPATIKIEPVSEQSETFLRVQEDMEDWADDDPTQADHCQQILQKWRALFQWFNDHSEFKDIACVAIGDRVALGNVPEEDYPPGTAMTPCVLPRLILGLTQGGSLCGLFGVTVQT